MSTVKFISVPSKRLAISIDGSAATFQLNNILGWDGVALTAASFGAQAYAVFRNDTNTAMEIMEFDPATIASASITILNRGLKFDGDLTTVVALNKLTWIKNTTIVELGTDVPQLLNHAVQISGAQTIDGQKIFTTPPQSTVAPSAGNDIPNKMYVDQVVTGTTYYDQQTLLGVAGQTLVAGNLVYFKEADQRWWLSDQATSSTCVGVQLGFAQGAALAGANVTILTAGLEKNQIGMTLGVKYYAGTSGAISSSAGATNEVFIGNAKTATQLLVNFNSKYLPTFKEKAALVGTSGTPSTTNKFVTQADVAVSTLQGAYSVETGAANAYVVTLSPVPAAYTAGMVITFKAINANTTASTVNVNGLGVKSITKFGTTALLANDILANQLVTLVYDGTQFQLVSPAPSTALVGNEAVSFTTTHNSNNSSTGITITTDGTQRLVVMYDCVINWAYDGQNHSESVDLMLDGVSQASYGIFTSGANNPMPPVPCTICFVTAVLSAASHTVKIKHTDSTGAGTANPTVAGTGSAFTIK